MSNEEDRMIHESNFKTTISIKVSTREKLKKEGIKGDSYDNIILRLIEKAHSKPVVSSEPSHFWKQTSG